MQRACTVEEVCHAIIFLTSQHSKKLTGHIMNVDGGKNLTIRGQHTWYGMNEDQTRGFEVGESTSVIDFFKTKLRGRINTNGKIVNSSNPDVNQFVEQNSTSLWGKKD